MAAHCGYDANDVGELGLAGSRCGRIEAVEGARSKLPPEHARDYPRERRSVPADERKQAQRSAEARRVPLRPLRAMAVKERPEMHRARRLEIAALRVIAGIILRERRKVLTIRRARKRRSSIVSWSSCTTSGRGVSIPILPLPLRRKKMNDGAGLVGDPPSRCLNEFDQPSCRQNLLRATPFFLEPAETHELGTAARMSYPGISVAPRFAWYARPSSCFPHRWRWAADCSATRTLSLSPGLKPRPRRFSQACNNEREKCR